MIRLWIADDHAIVRQGLKQILSLATDIQVVGESVNGSDVLGAMRQADCDLLMLDMDMPGIGGADLIARLTNQRPDIPLLVLTMYSEAHMANRAIKAGASGYVTKDCETQTLLAAIRKVAARGHFIAPELAEQMLFRPVVQAGSAPHAELSDRQLDVLRLLARGLSVNDIAAQLAISDKTVSTHKSRLMEKLNFSSMSELVRYAVFHKLVG